MTWEIIEQRVEHVEADALLVRVDGQLCVLAGAIAVESARRRLGIFGV